MVTKYVISFNNSYWSEHKKKFSGELFASLYDKESEAIDKVQEVLLKQRLNSSFVEIKKVYGLWDQPPF